MTRPIIIALIFLLPLNIHAAEVKSSTSPTQGDLIVGLTDSLGLSFGLPDEPQIDDYITILNGRRIWRFEFEDIIIPSAEAPLAPKETRTFGPFSGKFWLRAPGRDIEPEFSFLLPLSGRYEIKAALTKPGYKINIAESQLTADGDKNFSEVSFGSVELSAGQQTAKISIPNRGGIDYLLLEAPPLPSISPRDGWTTDKTLEHQELAVVIARTLALEQALEPTTGVIEIEAEEAPTPADSICCEDRYRGPIQGEWVKAGMRTANYSHLFKVEQAGIFDLYLNILGRRPIDGQINGKDFFTITPKKHFTTIYAGSFFLDKGVNQIDIELPSRSGFDRFILKPRASTADDYIRLVGINDETELTAAQLDQILRLVAAIGERR